MALINDVVCVGDNCIDYYLPPIDLTFAGGNALNTAIYIGKTGVKTAYVGMVGDDEEGRFMLDSLANQGLDTAHVKVLPGKTSHTDIRLNERRERQFIYEWVGPLPRLELDQSDLEFIQMHRLVHNTWMGRTEVYIPQFKKKGALISVDFGERCTKEFLDFTLPHSDLAFFSLPEEQANKAEELALESCRRGPRLVVVTCGSQGSLAAYHGEIYRQPAVPAEVVDTLGAGDTFIGTFLGNWLQDKPIPVCLEMAARKAAETCTHYGGWR